MAVWYFRKFEHVKGNNEVKVTSLLQSSMCEQQNLFVACVSVLQYILTPMLCAQLPHYEMYPQYLGQNTR